MKVGTICFATDQGLGYLAKSFFDHGIITDPLVLLHGRRTDHLEWYPPSTPFVADLHYRKALTDHCDKCDVMLFFETPFDWSLFAYCRSARIRTVLMPMHECMPAQMPDVPDLYLCPSGLDVQWACRNSNGGKVGVNMMPVPVEMPWRQRTRCEVFVHNAGNGGLKGRNGTQQVVEAFDKHVQSPAKLLLRAQDHRVCGDTFLNPRNTAVQFGTVGYDTLWHDGDCFVFPEKFNGLSLPLQEARAAGMLVMCADRFPMNTWLPREPLISVEGYVKSRVAGRYAEFDEAVVSPRQIAKTIDEWYGQDITEYSQQGYEWAKANSWEVLGPKYLKVLRG